MNWIFYAVTAGIATNVFHVISRKTLRGSGDSTAYAWWFEFIRILLFIPFLWIDFHLIYSSSALISLLLLGITEVISIYLLMRVHQLTEVSLSSIVSVLRLVWTPLLAFFLIAERLTTFEYLGIAVITLGIFVVASPRRIKTDKSLWILIVFSGVSAIIGVLMKQASFFASPPIVMIAMAIPSVVILPLFMKNQSARIITFGKDFLVTNVFVGLLNVVSTYLFLLAIQTGTTSVVISVYQGMILTSVFTGIVFLQERKDVGKKLAGLAITLCGVLLLTLYS